MRKIGKVSYDVNGPADNRFVRCPIEIKPGRYLTAADIEAILKKEFPGVPRKNILFSLDSHHLYFGNDRIPNRSE